MEIVEQEVECLTPSSWYRRYPKIIELAGRVCYKSEDKITEDSALRFVRGLIKSGHESVLEHCSLTFRFITDRAIANALVRHRHCSFSQESTHYIDYKKKKGSLTFVEQEGLIDNTEFEAYLYAVEAEYMRSTNKAINNRAMLPLALKTELVMTANIREWRQILKIRIFGKDHPQMVELMRQLYVWFKQWMPIFVEDIEHDFGQRKVRTVRKTRN